jgi:type IV pilus assembly protein PilF
MLNLSPSRSSSFRAHAALGIGSIGSIAGLLMTGCPARTNPGAQSPERQSETEYDVARDLFYKGQPRIALDHALKAVELSDENAKALYFVGAIYAYFCSEDEAHPDCKMDKVESYARKSVAADESFRDAKNFLGQALILRGKYAEAIKVLEPLTKDPAFAAAHLAWGNLGQAQILSGQLDAGILSLKVSVSQPKFCIGHYRLGAAYVKKNDFVAADRSFSAAVEVDSPECKNLQSAFQERAAVRLRLGRAEEAAADFARCREIAPDNKVGKACVKAIVERPSASPGTASTTAASTTAVGPARSPQ